MSKFFYLEMKIVRYWIVSKFVLWILNVILADIKLIVYADNLFQNGVETMVTSGSREMLLTLCVNENTTMGQLEEILSDYDTTSSYLSIAFLAFSETKIFSNQDVLSYLVRKNIVVDLKCPIHFLSIQDDLKACSIKKSIQFNLDVVILYDNDTEMIEMPKSRQISRGLIRTFYQIPKAPLSVHQEKYCNLWWPLNETDIILHDFTPSTFEHLQLQQRYILSCSFPSTAFSAMTKSLHLSIKLFEINGNISSSNFQMMGREVRHIFRQDSSLYQKDNLFYFSPLTVESLLTCPYSTEPVRKKQILVKIEDSLRNKELSSFYLELNVLYLSELLSERDSSTVKASANDFTLTSFMKYSSVLSQIESRDDLGFILSTLYPPNRSTTLNFSINETYGNPRVFVEIGVNKGNYAQLILNTWPKLDYYIGIDSWKKYPLDEYVDIANTPNDEEHERNYQETLMKLSQTNNNHTKKIIIRQDSQIAVNLFADQSIDIVYLDAMHHYSAVWNDLVAWWPKVKIGGLFLGHDYLLDVLGNTIFTVKPAVEKFARTKKQITFQTIERDCPSFPTWMILKTEE